MMTSTANFAEGELAAVWPEWDDSEVYALVGVLRSGRWSRVHDDSPETSVAGQLEAELASHLGVHHVLTVTSGTAALELALLASGVGPGDEVVVPACGFVAVPTAVARCGATPVFADVEPEHGTIAARAVEACLTPQTKAVIAVDLCGVPADIPSIVNVCAPRRVRVIEDSAHGWGSEHLRGQAGTLADIGCFSFVLGKALSCGEGGALATDDDELAAAFTGLHNPFTLRSTWSAPAPCLGTTARLSNWHAAVLRQQLRRVDAQIERRRRNWDLLAAMLVAADAPLQLVAPPERLTRWNVYDPPLSYQPQHLAGRPKADVVEALRAHGVPAERGHFDPVYGWDQLVNGPIRFRNPGCPLGDALGPQRLILRQHFFMGYEEWMHRLTDIIMATTNKLA